MTVLPKGEDIVDIKVGDPGTTSDISQFRARLSAFSPFQRFKGDKGYIGEKQISTPHKKPKNSQLTFAQKQQNKEFSANRIYVEHVIRLLKIFRIAGERFRLNCKNYERVISTICGLVRFRIGALILPV